MSYASLGAIKSSYGCPSSFVLTEKPGNAEGAVCRNAAGVEIQVAINKSSCGAGKDWAWCNALVLYLALHYPATLDHGTLSALKADVLKSLQALSAWTWGWKNVKGALLAVARYRVPNGTKDDETMAALEKPAGDWYDAAVAKAKAAAAAPKYLSPGLIAALAPKKATAASTYQAPASSAPAASKSGGTLVLVLIGLGVVGGGYYAWKKGYLGGSQKAHA